jgi:hypothetical protein
MVAGEELLPQAVLRQIGDKLYEKRKMAALEVEQIVKRLAAAGDTTKISSIIDKLIAEFAFSPQANHRKVSSCSSSSSEALASADMLDILLLTVMVHMQQAGDVSLCLSHVLLLGLCHAMLRALSAVWVCPADPPPPWCAIVTKSSHSRPV